MTPETTDAKPAPRLVFSVKSLLVCSIIVGLAIGWASSEYRLSQVKPDVIQAAIPNFLFEEMVGQNINDISKAFKTNVDRWPDQSGDHAIQLYSSCPLNSNIHGQDHFRLRVSPGIEGDSWLFPGSEWISLIDSKKTLQQFSIPMSANYFGTSTRSNDELHCYLVIFAHDDIVIHCSVWIFLNGADV